MDRGLKGTVWAACTRNCRAIKLQKDLRFSPTAKAIEPYQAVRVLREYPASIVLSPVLFSSQLALKGREAAKKTRQLL